MTRQRLYQLKLKAEGKCVTACGKKSRPGKTQCQECADKSGEATKRWLAKGENKERHLGQVREWRRANLDYVREWQRAYYRRKVGGGK